LREVPARTELGLSFGGGGVEGVGKHAVDAEVGDKGEAVVGRKIDAVSVRGFLAGGVYARAGVLDDGAEGAEATVRLEAHGGRAAAAVVGDEEGLAGGVHDDVARAGVAGGLLVEEFEFAGGGA